jgi:adenosylcobinamide-GDP ribazoletransferase
MFDIIAATAEALRFWSRLPIPILPVEVDPHAPPDMARLAPVVPLAGAILGGVGLAGLVAATSLGLPAWPAAILATAAVVWATGAMHEDALADVADGLGGGRGTLRKLEIMKDPRLGSYGAAALCLAILLRVALLAALVEAAGAWRAGLAFVAAASISRIVGLWPLVALAPARADGIGATASRLDRVAWLRGAALGTGLAGLVGWLAIGSPAALLAPFLAFAAGGAVAKLAERLIGGQTGDICGAATLLAELTALCALLAPVPG